MSVRFYLSLCCGRTAPEVSQEEVSYASSFYRWFIESFKSCLLLFTSRGSATFNWHSCIAATLKVSAMIIYDVVTKVLDTESFPQHNIAGLISGNTFVLSLSQEKPLRWEEIYTHAYTCTRAHTHTHIHTHTHTHTHTNTYTHTHTHKTFNPLALEYKGKTCRSSDI